MLPSLKQERTWKVLGLNLLLKKKKVFIYHQYDYRLTWISHDLMLPLYLRKFHINLSARPQNVTLRCWKGGVNNWRKELVSKTTKKLQIPSSENCVFAYLGYITKSTLIIHKSTSSSLPQITGCDVLRPWLRFDLQNIFTATLATFQDGIEVTLDLGNEGEDLAAKGWLFILLEFPGIFVQGRCGECSWTT